MAEKKKHMKSAFAKGGSIFNIYTKKKKLKG
jgi:hypothetical protein